MSTKHRRSRTGAVIAWLLVAACSTRAGTGSPLPPATTAATTTTAFAGVELTVSGCSAPPVTFALLCEVHELLEAHHRAPPTDSALAAAALLGVNSFTTEAIEEMPRGITCAIPAEAFVPLCDRVLERVETESAPLLPMVEAAVQAMLAGTVDPYTTYIPPELAGAVGEDGIIPGVGVVVAALTVAGSPCVRIGSSCPLQVVSVVSGGPAELAGLRTGDVITEVDGAPVDGKTVIEVAGSINGEPGTSVLLDVDRPGATEKVEVRRAEGSAVPVSGELVGTTGYLRLPEFGPDTHLLFHYLLAALIDGGARRLVLDLRDNPGGFLYSVSIIGSEFFSSGLLYRTLSRSGDLDYPAVEGGIASRLPVIAVVNGSSASAAEILAAVLQERGRALVVGSPTFGKNLVQVPFELHNGGYLRVTTAEWITPAGASVAATGVVPDVAVDFGTDLTIEEVVETALAAAG